MALPNYGIIEPAVFRSAFPTPDTFAHVRTLALRTVVNLSQEALTRAAAAFLAEQNVQVADVGLQVWTHPACEPISHELIKEALRYVLDKAHHPLLAVSGPARTRSARSLAACGRMQGWTLSSTLEEYRHFAAPSARLATEHFIELWGLRSAHTAIEQAASTLVCLAAAAGAARGGGDTARGSSGRESTEG